MAIFDNHNIDRYQSLFHGREDIYAGRWEKDGKSGYMPAYDVDWDEYKKQKAQGGMFRDFEGKKPLPFSKNAIIEHLNGRATIGIYALLPDNSSWFIAADFDGNKWENECLTYLKECKSNNIPAYHCIAIKR